MQYFGYEILITIIIPGFIAFVSIWSFLLRFFPKSRLCELLMGTLDKEWMFGIIILVSSTLLGSFIATIMGYIEGALLDDISIKEIHKSDKDYSDKIYEYEWNSYIDSLETNHNSYISRLVLHYFFESRISISIGFLCFSLMYWVTNVGELLGCLFLFILSICLFVQCIGVHTELARFRHRRFYKNTAFTSNDKEREDNSGSKEES